MTYLVKLESVNLSDISKVGGKNAAIGELIQHLVPKGVNVMRGYATTTELYHRFITGNFLQEIIAEKLSQLDIENVRRLEDTANHIQSWIMAAPFPRVFEEELAAVYDSAFNNASVAVRSSATMEDLAMASFAGQQDTYLNVQGVKNVLKAVKLVFASLYTSRAIAYRHQYKMTGNVAMSVGIQPMVRSDKGVSGVMFTLDTESGFDQVILITGSYGLGEALVQGKVNADEFVISKPLLKAKRPAILQRRLGEKEVKMIYSNSKRPHNSTRIISVQEHDRWRFCLTDQDLEFLSQQALLIEDHFGRPMDIEWAKDGLTGEIVILQSRPETVASQKKQKQSYKQYSLLEKKPVLVEGQSVGQGIGKGIAKVIYDRRRLPDIKPGEIIVTDMTDPDWEPIIKQAGGIITNRGGRTCHAAIIARELGIPAIVGCNDAMRKIKNNMPITFSCAEGQQGYVYEGLLEYEEKNIPVTDLVDIPVNLCLNLGNPERAFAARFLPSDGVGLARVEFIISNMIGIHPGALLHYDTLPKNLKLIARKQIFAYPSPTEFYVEKLREGIATIAAAFFPKQVIFRFSDFKSNEYANLLGGNLYEPKEANPMLGLRGASRYKHEVFKESFALECQAFKRVRDDMGLVNAQLMVPFVRTVDELREVIELIESHGLKRGENDLKIYMMCEIPANVLLAEEFLKHVDGFSIGSNDLTQLTLGVDRDSSLVSSAFDERSDAVKALLSMVIKTCKNQRKYISICGQGPSDYFEFAKWLVNEGIENISLSPDAILGTWIKLANNSEEVPADNAEVLE